MKLYGIKNCDTVKKARRWLESQQIAYSFHDLRSDGLDKPMVERWLQSVTAAQLLNKRSTTWKSLDSGVRDTVHNADVADLLVAHPTLVKRPVLERGDEVMVGFNEKTYNVFFSL